MKALLILLAFSGAGTGDATGAEPIRIRGSDTLGAKLVPLLCQEYRKAHPDRQAAFDIAAEGSSTAFAALLEGTAEIGMSSRDIRKEEIAAFAEKGVVWQRHLIAYDALCIVVHEANPLVTLTSRQVEGLFTGDLPNWRQVGGADLPVRVLTPNTSSGTYKDFQRLVMSGRPYAAATGGDMMLSGGPVVMDVAKAPGAIGFAGLMYSKSKGVKVLLVDGKAIDPKAPQKYPYARGLLLFTREDASAGVLAFVTWIRQSEAAARVIEQVGFLPDSAGRSGK